MPRKKKITKTASSLAGNRWGRRITAAEANVAAVALGKRRAKLAGKAGMGALGRLGCLAYWGSMTPEERRIEQRRRASVRKKNRAARLAELVAKR